MKKKLSIVVLTGLLLGIAGVALMLLGNPGNMGFCIACFIRDTAGALKLHTAPVVQYARPEIMGLILGSFIISIITKEFKPQGGSSPMLRFVLGMILMISALVFLGCPLRMVLRMAAGDLSAWVGVVGFIVGVYIGTIFLKKGFSLGRATVQPKLNGYALPAFQVVLFILLVAGSGLLAYSEKGPGSMRANLWIAMLIALVLGALAQRARLCQAGGLRDVFLIRDFQLFWGGLAIFVGALVVNLIAGKFQIVPYGPIAHQAHLWNLLPMIGVGMASVLLGGCPMRQLILTGTGNFDSAITVIGMAVGAAFAHNWGMASGPHSLDEAGNLVGGPTLNGKIATIVCLALLVLIGMTKRQPQKARR